MVLDGCKSFVPALLATVAFVVGSLGNFYCETVAFPLPRVGLTLYSNAFSYRTIAIAELNNQTYVFNVCQRYSTLEQEIDNFDYSIDATTRTVKAFAILALIFGAMGICLAYFVPCTRKLGPTVWKAMGGIFLTTTLFQGLTLLILQSSICHDNPFIQFVKMLGGDSSSDPGSLEARFPEECEVSKGFRQTMASVILYFVAGVLAFVIPPPDGSLLSPIDMTPTEDEAKDTEKAETSPAEEPGKEAPGAPNEEEEEEEEEAGDTKQ